jgi:hypothetical protein
MPAKGTTKLVNTGAFCAAFERDLDVDRLLDRDLILLRFLEASLTGIDQDSAELSAAGMR